MRIMIVDDDPDVTCFLEETLRSAGHEPTSFGHGALAMGAIVRGNFELLLCDLMLPNVSGVDTIKMIRSQLPYLPVVVVSALDPIDWEERTREVGASCFLQKPVRIERLLKEVKLIEDSQVDLSVGIIDGDDDHREKLRRDLGSLGCDMRSWPSLRDMLVDGQPDVTVLLVDGVSSEAIDVMAWAASRNIAGVAFGAEGPEFNQDALMRSGASFCLDKPVDGEALVTQARFFVSPGGF